MSEHLPPKPPSALWKWTRRVGCTLTLALSACCLVTCGGSWWMQDSLRNMNKDEVDRIHLQGLHAGDLKAIHANADPEFRKRFTLEDLQKFLNEHPGVLDRENFFGMEFVRRKFDGVEYVKIKSKRGWFSLFEQTELVFKIVDGEYQLIGISPGMDELVPLGFRIGAGGGRRRGWG